MPSEPLALESPRPMTHGPLMLDLAGAEMQPEEREMLRHPAAGGVILFARNYQNPQQLKALTAEIHAVRQPSLLVAVDQEGGRVQRFREGFIPLPPAAWFGAYHDRDPKRSLEAAHHLGWLMAAELRSAGVDFSFAPVLDLGRGNNTVIGDRAFHRHPTVAADLARAWCHGVREAGMIAVGKHFPGHGGVTEDSHLALPTDPRGWEDIRMDDLLPFERLIADGLEAVMPAHVVYPEVAPEPAGFSPRWLKKVLREGLGFQGVIFSDDLSMGAAASGGDYPERARKALAAGCDMVLVCNNPAGAHQVLRALAGFEDPVVSSRIARLHGRHADNHQRVRQDRRWKQALGFIAEYEESSPLSLEL